MIIWSEVLAWHYMQGQRAGRRCVPWVDDLPADK